MFSRMRFIHWSGLFLITRRCWRISLINWSISVWKWSWNVLYTSKLHNKKIWGLIAAHLTLACSKHTHSDCVIWFWVYRCFFSSALAALGLCSSGCRHGVWLLPALQVMGLRVNFITEHEPNNQRWQQHKTCNAIWVRSWGSFDLFSRVLFDKDKLENNCSRF